MHTETHSAQEFCGFVWALCPCLVSCAGSASVWAQQLMVSRFLYRQGAGCYMFRPSCGAAATFLALQLYLLSRKPLCIHVEPALQQDSRRGLSFDGPNDGKSLMVAQGPTIASSGFLSTTADTTDTLSGSSSRLLAAPQLVQECHPSPCAPVSMHDTM